MKARPHDDAVLRDPSADTADRASALSRLTSDRRLDLEPEIRPLLDAPQPMLRSEALITLVGRWWRDDHVDAAVEHLRRDPDASVRRDAATALGMFVNRTGRRRAELARTLVAALREDPDQLTRRRVYGELLRILAAGHTAAVPDDFDADVHVDWALLEPYV